MIRSNWPGIACALLLVAGTAQAASDQEKCLAGRLNAKAKFEQCVQKWRAKGYATGGYDPAKLSKCRETYVAIWPKLRKLNESPTCGGVERFVDNGDGTVTDNLSGLIWEQKTDDGTDHDKDNVYTWSSSDGDRTDEDGTVFTTFLANLNSAGFAGANGWRLPTSMDLLTLLSEPYPCATQPCIDPLFVNTMTAPPGIYSSITTFDVAPDLAMGVRFTDGREVDMQKFDVSYYARAVRGGS